jgi:hypothetical protein
MTTVAAPNPLAAPAVASVTVFSAAERSRAAPTAWCLAAVEAPIACLSASSTAPLCRVTAVIATRSAFSASCAATMALYSVVDLCAFSSNARSALLAVAFASASFSFCAARAACAGAAAAIAAVAAACVSATRASAASAAVLDCASFASAASIVAAAIAPDL